MDPNSDRFFNYDFIVTILWIGFVIAISFIEAPLRFQAEGITTPIALQVGRLVFHALNYCEIAFAIWLTVCHFTNQGPRNTRLVLLLVLLILVIQTLLLFVFLDPRTSAIIAGQEVESASYHTIYIFLEVAKLLSLVLLARSQLRDFKNRLTNR